jgi:O-antigen ligase
MKKTKRDTRIRRLLRGLFLVFGVVLVLGIYAGTVDPAGPIKTIAISIAGLVIGAVWLLGAGMNREPLRRPPAFFHVVAAFLALTLATSLISAHTGKGLNVFTLWCALGVLYLVASDVYRTREQVERWLMVVCVCTAIASVYGFLQRFGIEFMPYGDISEELRREPPATFGNPNYAAHTLVLVILFAAYLGFEKSRRWCWALLPLLGAALLLTGARGPLLALLVGAAVVGCGAWVARKKMAPGRAVAVTLSVAWVVGLVALGGSVLGARAVMGQSSPDDSSSWLRMNAYEGAARMAADHPLAGFGPGSYEIENVGYWTAFEQRWFAEARTRHARVHNDYLELAVESGLAAPLLYLGFLATGVVYGLFLAFRAKDANQRRLGFMFAAFFAAYSVDGVFGFNLRVPVSASLLFVVAGFLEAMGRDSAPSSVKPHYPALSWGLRFAGCALLMWAFLFQWDVFQAKRHLLIAKAAVDARIYKEAERRFHLAEARTPWDWTIPLDRGRAHLAAGNLETAARSFDQALALHPKYPITLVSYGQVYLKRGLAAGNPGDHLRYEDSAALQALDEAASLAERAQAFCPRLPEAEDLLGRVASVRAVREQALAGKGGPTPDALPHWEAAEAHYRRALEYGADTTGNLYTVIAETHLGRNNPEGAMAAYADALSNNPADTEAWTRYYTFATKFDRTDDLERRMLDAIPQLRGEPSAGMHVALLLAKFREVFDKDIEAAERAYVQAVTYGELRAEAWSAFTRFAIVNRRDAAYRDAFLKVYGKALGKRDTIPAAFEALAVLWNEGEAGVGEAVERLAVGLAQSPAAGAGGQSPQVRLGWAAEMIRFALVNMSEDSIPRARALLKLGEFYARLGEPVMADRLYVMAIQGLPPADKPMAVRRHAEALVAMNGYAEAIAKTPNDLGLQLEVARALVRAKRGEEGVNRYRHLLEHPLVSQGQRAVVMRELSAAGG